MTIIFNGFRIYQLWILIQQWVTIEWHMRALLIHRVGNSERVELITWILYVVKKNSFTNAVHLRIFLHVERIMAQNLNFKQSWNLNSTQRSLECGHVKFEMTHLIDPITSWSFDRLHLKNNYPPLYSDHYYHVYKIIFQKQIGLVVLTCT